MKRGPGRAFFFSFDALYVGHKERGLVFLNLVEIGSPVLVTICWSCSKTGSHRGMG
jgi:hypothetical protein